LRYMTAQRGWLLESKLPLLTLNTLLSLAAAAVVVRITALVVALEGIELQQVLLHPLPLITQ
jgi:hypothetical protein